MLFGPRRSSANVGSGSHAGAPSGHHTGAGALVLAGAEDHMAAEKMARRSGWSKAGEILEDKRAKVRWCGLTVSKHVLKALDAGI